MVNLNISVHQGGIKDGSTSFISIDVFKREDATDLEYNLVKILEKTCSDIIKTIPNFKTEDYRSILTKDYNEVSG